MEALLEVRAVEGVRRNEEASPRPNERIPSGALDALAAEAREVLEKITQLRSGASRDGVTDELELLRALPRRGDWTDVMDLPTAGLSGRNILRGRIVRMAGEGLVELRRNETYPNMMSVRLGVAGREALRRHAAKEAMSLLRLSGGDAYRDLTKAREALRRLADRIG